MFNSTQLTDNQPDSMKGLTASTPNNRIALLLSGGNGARLQELTKEIAGISIPEQYCRSRNEFAKLSKSVIHPIRQRNYIESLLHGYSGKILARIPQLLIMLEAADLQRRSANDDI